MATTESLNTSASTDSDDGKKKRYGQAFRFEWLADTELKEWLARDKTGSAFCKWCNCSINAKLSVLRTQCLSDCISF